MFIVFLGQRGIPVIHLVRPLLAKVPAHPVITEAHYTRTLLSGCPGWTTPHHPTRLPNRTPLRGTLVHHTTIHPTGPLTWENLPPSASIPLSFAELLLYFNNWKILRNEPQKYDGFMCLNCLYSLQSSILGMVKPS